MRFRQVFCANDSRRWGRRLALLLCVPLLAGLACSTRAYDVVIENGHVMDPESGFDRVAHVGIVGDRIEAISEVPLTGAATIDATGLIVAPGHLDIHGHREDALNYAFRALDGFK
jgi:hypothetical protein